MSTSPGSSTGSREKQQVQFDPAVQRPKPALVILQHQKISRADAVVVQSKGAVLHLKQLKKGAIDGQQQMLERLGHSVERKQIVDLFLWALLALPPGSFNECQ
jgi:hypothetical protein